MKSCLPRRWIPSYWGQSCLNRESSPWPLIGAALIPPVILVVVGWDKIFKGICLVGRIAGLSSDRRTLYTIYFEQQLDGK